MKLSVILIRKQTELLDAWPCAQPGGAAAVRVSSVSLPASCPGKDPRRCSWKVSAAPVQGAGMKSPSPRAGAGQGWSRQGCSAPQLLCPGSVGGIGRFGSTRAAREPQGPHPGPVWACGSLGAGSKGQDRVSGGSPRTSIALLAGSRGWETGTGRNRHPRMRGSRIRRRQQWQNLGFMDLKGLGSLRQHCRTWARGVLQGRSLNGSLAKAPALGTTWSLRWDN